jgi:photosystem II stability/assembly factor-like uncharacterized protein
VIDDWVKYSWVKYRCILSRRLQFGCALLALSASLVPLRAEKWQVQYFYDKEKSTLVFNDLQFASATRGAAVGVIVEGSRRKPIALVTADGGAHWETIQLKETPVSLFFLNENFGWMVTEKGLWQTTEAGKNWRKLPKLPAPANRVYFADEKMGWAVCFKKTVLETRDGGETWAPVPAAADLPGSKDTSAFNWIAFATPQFGLITGFNQPAQRMLQTFPTWMDPEDAISHRDTPHLSYTLVTKDGGKTWKSSAASLFGNVTRVRFGAHGVGVGLIEYSESFRYPSEAYKIDWTTGKSTTLLRDKRFAIRDVWMMNDGTVYLAGIAVAGELRSVIPGRVQVMKSKDLTAWTQVDVDYRAAARHVTLAGRGEDNLWMVTDNGMILKLM